MGWRCVDDGSGGGDDGELDERTAVPVGCDVGGPGQKGLRCVEQPYEVERGAITWDEMRHREIR